MSDKQTHPWTTVAAHPQREFDSPINPNSISLLTRKSNSSTPNDLSHTHQSIRAVPAHPDSGDLQPHEDNFRVVDSPMRYSANSEDAEIVPSAMVNSSELQDCEFEPPSTGVSHYRSASDWITSPQIAHPSYYGSSETANDDGPSLANSTAPKLLRHSPSREIKRDPQSVEVLHISETNAEFHQPKPMNNQSLAAHDIPRSQSLQQALQAATLSDAGNHTAYDDHSDNFYSLETYRTNNVDEEDEERGPTLLESLPTPRVVSPKSSYPTDSFRTSSSQSALDHLALNSPPASAPQELMAQRWSGARDSMGSSLLLSQSPQISQSSTSDKSGGSTSPRLAPMRPKSAASTRLVHRQSYYDFAPSTNNFNLSLGDAASAAVSANRSVSSSNVLIPRMKTIELYRRNARKTNDPELEFQLAQYMIQTALMATSDKATDRAKLEAEAEHSGTPTSVASSNYKSVKSSSTTGSNASKYSEVALERPVDKTVEKIFKEAMNSLKRLSERGFADAQYLLGDIYSTGALAKLDMERSFKYMLMAAKHGHAEAAYRVALCFQEGWGTSRDAARAIQFYNMAAVRNQPGALYQLGMAYFHGGMGLGDTSANKLAGVKWLSRAVNGSDQIYNRAPHELAKIYEVGFKDLVIPDNEYAIKLYAHSADLGFIPSAARLGRAYEYGELGCPQDPNLSIHYNTIAALGNDPKAQLAMCAWYMVGAGPTFPINHDEAFEWALRAALNGLPKAQFTLGFFYENGTGTKRNIVEAGKWYRRAAENGHEKAIAKLKSLGVTNNDKQKGKCLVM